jgi:hypothetical protein
MFLEQLGLHHPFSRAQIAPTIKTYTFFSFPSEGKGSKMIMYRESVGV